MAEDEETATPHIASNVSTQLMLNDVRDHRHDGGDPDGYRAGTRWLRWRRRRETKVHAFVKEAVSNLLIN